MQAHPTDNLEAYDLYLKGVQMVTSNRPVLIEQAAGYFDRAIALDENYADAWAAKGWALGTLGHVGSGSIRIPASVYPDAIAAARRALEIDSEHAFATGWLGTILMSNDFKWEEGIRLMRRGLALNPNDAAMLAVYGFYMDTMQIEGASEVVERAYRLDPLGMEPILDRAIHLNRKGRTLDAAIMVEASLIEDRDGYEPNYFSVIYNLRLGRLDVAEERLRKARLVAHPVDLNLDVLGWLIDSRRGKGPLPSAEIGGRLQTEHLYGLVLWDGWADEKAIVDAFDLAIKQRHLELRSVLFGPKPPLMPEADWVRIKHITGATEFQQGEFYKNWKSGDDPLLR
jgi:tetratricopeptide (TPR) repeat protein